MRTMTAAVFALVVLTTQTATAHAQTTLRLDVHMANGWNLTQDDGVPMGTIYGLNVLAPVGDNWAAMGEIGMYSPVVKLKPAPLVMLAFARKLPDGWAVGVVGQIRYTPGYDEKEKSFWLMGAGISAGKKVADWIAVSVPVLLFHNFLTGDEIMAFNIRLDFSLVVF